MVVRGGVVPPTPRFSGALNGSKLANAVVYGLRGALLRAWDGHDSSRLVTACRAHVGSSRRVCAGCIRVTGGHLPSLLPFQEGNPMRPWCRGVGQWRC